VAEKDSTLELEMATEPRITVTSEEVHVYAADKAPAEQFIGVFIELSPRSSED
jgi:hypothetical protein